MTQQVVLARTTMPAIDSTTDPASFSLHFEATGANPGIDFGSLGPAIASMINSVALGAVNAPQHYLSPELNRSALACETEFYDITAVLGGGAFGSPVNIHTWTLGGDHSATALPAGVACAVEYRAEYGTDVEFGPGTRPRSRDRNRFYLGPLATACLAYDSTTYRPHFSAQFITDIQAAVHDISLLNNGEDNQSSLVVWSRKNAGIKHAKYCVMDDRPDYQRRRSDPTPGSRVTLPILD